MTGKFQQKEIYDYFLKIVDQINIELERILKITK
jgi:hypothetical protein